MNNRDSSLLDCPIFWCEMIIWDSYLHWRGKKIDQKKERHIHLSFRGINIMIQSQTAHFSKRPIKFYFPLLPKLSPCKKSEYPFLYSIHKLLSRSVTTYFCLCIFIIMLINSQIYLFKPVGCLFSYLSRQSNKVSVFPSGLIHSDLFDSGLISPGCRGAINSTFSPIILASGDSHPKLIVVILLFFAAFVWVSASASGD